MWRPNRKEPGLDYTEKDAKLLLIFSKKSNLSQGLKKRWLRGSGLVPRQKIEYWCELLLSDMGWREVAVSRFSSSNARTLNSHQQHCNLTPTRRPADPVKSTHTKWSFFLSEPGPRLPTTSPWHPSLDYSFVVISRSKVGYTLSMIASQRIFCAMLIWTCIYFRASFHT